MGRPRHGAGRSLRRHLPPPRRPLRRRGPRPRLLSRNGHRPLTLALDPNPKPSPNPTLTLTLILALALALPLALALQVTGTALFVVWGFALLLGEVLLLLYLLWLYTYITMSGTCRGDRSLWPSLPY